MPEAFVGVISRCSHFWLLCLTVALPEVFVVHSSNIFRPYLSFAVMIARQGIEDLTV